MKKFMIFAMVLAMMAGVQAEFTLTGTQHLDVTTEHINGFLYESSSADILSGGTVYNLRALDNSTAFVSGGRIAQAVLSYDSSIASVSGGTVSRFFVYENSTAAITGGSVTALYTYENSTTSVSGGSVTSLYANDNSIVTFYGYDFLLGTGLSCGPNGQAILGTGILSGKWSGSTDTWSINIIDHDITATIMTVPEPATVSLLALGGLALLRRRK